MKQHFSLGRVVDGTPSYVPPEFLDDAFRVQKGTVWRYAKSFSTVRYAPYGAAQTSLKSIDRFGQKWKTEEVGRFIDEYLSHGGTRPPSSFASGFWLYFDSIRPSHAFDVFFGKFLTGGWQQGFAKGFIPGPLYRYDVNSAYTWAALQGLPRPPTYRVHRTPDRPGLYIVHAVAECDRPPRPFLHSVRPVLATYDEIKAYNLRVDKCSWGVTWDETDMIDIRPSIDLVRSAFTDWKQVLRTFWGRWAARTGPRTATFEDGVIKKEWCLPNLFRHYIWAHLLISRVKIRMHALSKGALRVWCDSIVTRETMPTGDEIGDWKLEAHFPEGATVLGNGLIVDKRSPKEFV